MRYYFISDVHGCYDKMIAALNEAGFNREQDTLISVGDPFDRGPNSKEVLEYIMGCPHRIIIIGNHDWRLYGLSKNTLLFDEYDIMNGIGATVRSFNGIPEGQPISYWEELPKIASNKLFNQYIQEANYAVEFSDLIAVHGWIPHAELSGGRVEPYQNLSQPDATWRTAPKHYWWDGVWSHTERCIEKKIYPEKTILIGHWHAWRLAQKFGEKRTMPKKMHEKYEYINCDKFIYKDKFIAIDGCSNWPNGGKVNVYIYTTDEKPTLYPFEQ